MPEPSPFTRLFEKTSLANVKLRNRIVMLPMGTAYAAASGEVTERTIAHYVERAKGGVGLVTVGNISPHRPNAPNQLSLDSDGMLMGHYELVENIHAQGAKVCAQLNCPGRQKYPEVRMSGEQLVSSSDIPGRFLDVLYPTPRALTRDEIHDFARAYAASAERAKRVGYDMVEIHGAHGYLVNQFISPAMNKRTDEFGGVLQNRMRFSLQVVDAVRQAVGPGFPVGIRMSAVEFVPEGVTLEESVIIARMLEDAGVAYLSVSVGTSETAHTFVDLMSDPEGWKEYIWEAIKKAVRIPVVVGGGLRHPEFCEDVLRKGNADFIGLARPLMADPEWPNKTRDGAVEDIRLCISCNECLTGSAGRRRGGGARRCTVNAAVGREREFSHLVPAQVAKNVVVIGGGPGGMEAARTAANRGHKVTLYEKGHELGGQMLLAGKPLSKRKVLWFRDYLASQLEKSGVRVSLGSEATSSKIAEARPDTVVVATGARPALIDIPGVTGKNVVTAWELLGEKVKPKKQSVAVIGGGMVGCEITDYLLELENTVTVIEQLNSLATDMEPFHRFKMLASLKENGVAVLTRRKAVLINEEGVGVVDLGNGAEELVKADWVVVATGAEPVCTLADELLGKVPEVHVVGDCSKPRVIMEAVYEGALAGRLI